MNSGHRRQWRRASQSASSAAAVLRGRWQALPSRDRHMLMLGFTVILMYVVWEWGIAPTLQASTRARQTLAATRLEAQALEQLLSQHALGRPPAPSQRDAALRQSLQTALPDAQWELVAQANARWELRVGQAPAAKLLDWSLRVPQRVGVRVLSADLAASTKTPKPKTDLTGTVVLVSEHEKTSDAQ